MWEVAIQTFMLLYHVAKKLQWPHATSPTFPPLTFQFIDGFVFENVYLGGFRVYVMWEVAIETFTYAYTSHSIQVSMATSHITHIPSTYPGTSISPTPSLQDIGEAIELSLKSPCLWAYFHPLSPKGKGRKS
jgi:hypothetical protein